MPATRKHSMRILQAAIALALFQGAAHAQAPAAASEPPKDEAKLAQATEQKVAQAPTTAPPGTVSAKKDAPGEQIVVTARRREELIQDVPGAVSAFSGAAIEQSGIQDVTGIADLVPNTTLKTSRATNSTLTAFIRGVGQQDPVPGYEQGVGIYLDDIYLARPQGALQDIYDLDRIEILRGPQGTLYGRNTIGGAVKYVTKRLSAKNELNLKVALGNYSEQDLVARGNFALSDSVRLGASVASFNHDGYGSNVVNGKENYNKDLLAGRVSAEFTPSSNLFIRIAADRTQDDSLPKQGYRLLPGTPPGNETVLPGNYDTHSNLYTVLGKEQEVTTRGESLLVDWAINRDLSFKSITAHRKGESVAPIDFDSLNRTLFEAPALYHDDQKSQEFQFTYTGSKLQGVAGAYFMKANAFAEFDVLYNAVVAQGLSLYTMADIDTKTWAVFADVNYDFSDKLYVTVGGRYTEDKREARIYKRNYLGMTGSPTLGNPGAVPFPTPTFVNTDMQKSDLNRTDTKFTPKIGAGWKFAPDQNLYASYSEGFKGGMFDPRMDLGGNPNSATSLEKRKGVEPEEVANWEVGLKSAFLGGRIQTNLAAFYMDYKNVQIPGSIPTYNAAGQVTGFAGNVTNAGKAKVKGLEFEGIARVTDQFTLSGMLGFINAEYKEWIVSNGLTGSAAALVNIASSAEFQNTPERQASITAAYNWPLGLFGKGGGVVLQGTASYKSKVYQGEYVRPIGVPAVDVVVPQSLLLAQNAFTLVDASLIWTSRDRKYTAGIVGRNLTDKRYKVAGYPFAGFYPNLVTAFYGDPRTVKFVASVTF